MAKVLAAINYRSTVLQARNATIDVEITNLSSFLVELNTIRDSWDTILNECRLLGTSLQINRVFSGKKNTKRKKRTQELKRTPAEEFKINVFIDIIIGNMTRRFNAAKEIDSLFNVLWLFRNLNDQEIQKRCEKLQKMCENDIDDHLRDEILHLKSIYDANIQNIILQPIELLNEIKKKKLDVLFPNIIIAIKLFCTIPVTVAQAERSFSMLKRIKNILRSTMTQNRLNDLGLLSIEAKMAMKINFEEIINLFASRKTRKTLL
ncbi:uncharacterized protein LOC136083014 [Hydra vulgaris]|uniref:Uncharacterized protein LOC136083014 n=1 Tax=Hydra vulgaris TaxID=6087 RepID=A0ABM4CA18_HYDVU